MYDIGTQVVIVNKSSGYAGTLARVADRHWAHDLGTGKRCAVYLVEYGENPVQDLMLRSRDIRLAEVQCDGCGGWRTRNQMTREVSYTGPGYDDIEAIDLCFLCLRSDITWPVYNHLDR